LRGKQGRLQAAPKQNRRQHRLIVEIGQRLIASRRWASTSKIEIDAGGFRSGRPLVDPGQLSSALLNLGWRSNAREMPCPMAAS